MALTWQKAVIEGFYCNTIIVTPTAFVLKEEKKKNAGPQSSSSTDTLVDTVVSTDAPVDTVIPKPSLLAEWSAPGSSKMLDVESSATVGNSLSRMTMIKSTSGQWSSIPLINLMIVGHMFYFIARLSCGRVLSCHIIFPGFVPDVGCNFDLPDYLMNK